MLFSAERSLSQKQTPSSAIPELFKRKFATTDSLLSVGQPRAALILVDQLNSAARKQNNSNLSVKSVLYRMLIQSLVEEDSYLKIIDTLRQDLLRAKQPEQNILHSLLADIYWKHYQQHQYTLIQRTDISGDSSSNISSWSAGKLLAETERQFRASVEPAQFLQSVQLDGISELLIGDSSTRSLRPSLYDLLAHRALSVFGTLESDWMTGSGLPVMRKEFRQYAEAIFDELSNYHLREGHKAAWIDLELKRADYNYKQDQNTKTAAEYENKLADLAKQASGMEILAEVAYRTALYHQAIYRGNSTQKADFVKAADYASRASSAYPRTLAGRNAAKLLKAIKQSELRMQVPTQVITNQPIQLQLSYKNLDSASFMLYKIPLKMNISTEIAGKPRGELLFPKHPLLHKWNTPLPTVKDYQTHTYQIRMDGLPVGRYLLVSTDTSKAPQFVDFKVTGMKLIQRTVGGKQQYMVADMRDGRPLKGVKIQEKSRDRTISATYVGHQDVLITDEEGMALSTSKIQNGEAIIYHNQDTLSTTIYTSHYKQPARKAILFTDRPIYRPGQKFFFKGIVVDNDTLINKVVAGTKFTVSFSDARHRQLDSMVLTTNNYGSIQGSFHIPDNGLNGQMRLSITDKNISIGELYVQVESYKRPSFELVFQPDDKSYRLNDSITLSGSARTFSGYKVGIVRVDYSVFRYGIKMGMLTDLQPFNEEIYSGTATPATDGSYQISFLAAVPEMNPLEGYGYNVKVTVTDRNGETQSAFKKYSVGWKDMAINLNAPPQLFLGSIADSIPYTVSRLNGSPCKATVRAEWIPLEAPEKLLYPPYFGTVPEKYALTGQEFSRTFPMETYGNQSDPTSWKEREVALRSTQYSNGAGTIYLKAGELSPGHYKLKVIAFDDKDTVRQQLIIPIYDSRPAAINTMAEWLVAEKTNILPTGQAIFRIAGAVEGATASYEVYYKGKMVERRRLRTGREQQIIMLKPAPGFEEGFAVQFTMVQQGRIYSEMHEVSIIDPRKTLNISFTTFRSKLQPGERESWKLKISSTNGEARMAELIATLYDASLDGLKKMSWDNINHTPFDHNAYRWQFQPPHVVYSEHGYFYSPQGYYPRSTYDYEQLNLFGYEYNGGYNATFREYQRRQQRRLTQQLQREAVKKLARLAKGNYVYGLITNAADETLPDIEVRCGTSKAVSDEYGIYQIRANTGQVLSFSHADFEPLKVKVGKGRSLDVRMKQKAGRPGTMYYSEIKKENLMAYASTVAAESKVFSPGTIRIRGTNIRQEVENQGAKPTIVEDTKVYDFVSINSYDAASDTYIINGKPVRGAKAVSIRNNFQETAFFYPQLQTNETGEISIEFTIPQSLTRYKMLGFAHDQDFHTATVSRELVTQKQLALRMYTPRFFRAGDTIIINTRIDNLAGRRLKGRVELELKDVVSGKTVQMLSQDYRQKFDLKDTTQQVLRWEYVIPAGLAAISCRAVAEAGAFSDGEEMIIPVLSDHMLVTEHMSLNVPAQSTKTFQMDKLLQNRSSTLRNQGITLEISSNPLWYAVQAIPYMMENMDGGCSEQLFSSFFANSLATGIVNSAPQIRAVFDKWKSLPTSEALLSNLDKNPELKAVLLAETPWIGAAEEETARKRRIALLFDLAHMDNELSSSLDKLQAMQLSNGAFPWFGGMNEDRYITQHIYLGMNQLKKRKLLSGQQLGQANNMTRRVRTYLDAAFVRQALRPASGNYLPLHYLYARSYEQMEEGSTEFKALRERYLHTIATEWTAMDTYQLAQSALILHRHGLHQKAMMMIGLLKDRAQAKEGIGMYWPSAESQLFWYQNDVERQCMLIEAFEEVAADTASVAAMKLWLMNHKQLNNWKTTKATAAACFTLLSGEAHQLREGTLPEVSLGGVPVDSLVTTVVPEPGTGYQKTYISGEQVTPAMGSVELKNPNKTMTWAALHWQYTEQLDRITAASNGLQLKKQLFLKQQRGNGDVLVPLNTSNVLKNGDLVTVRMEISTDRDMEYIHLKDMRASAFEPLNVQSGYRYRHGLGYYESTSDVATNFFISRLSRGSYVFEYDLRVSHSGSFSNGITSIQSFYAPEFAAHAEGMRVSVQ